MPNRRPFRLALLALALGAVAPLAGCNGDGTEPPPTRNTDELTFLRLAPGAPPLPTTPVTFWAVKGEDAEVRLSHAPLLGSPDSTEFLRFRLDRRSLLRRPDGTPIAEGDSVLITIALVDVSRLIINFQPAGLRFDPDRPAELRIRFAETEDDLDDDGDVDDDDDRARRQLSLWRQEALGLPWVKLSSELDVDNERIEAKLRGFTNYAVAY